LSVNRIIIATINIFVTLFQPLSSTPLPIKIPNTTPGTALPIMICASPPKMVPQKPERLPASSAASQKITGIAKLISQSAAGAKTSSATLLNPSGIDAVVILKKATTIAPIIAPAMLILNGLCIVSSTVFPFLNNAAADQLGIILCATSAVNAPAPTADAHALKKKPNPNEKCEALSP